MEGKESKKDGQQKGGETDMRREGERKGGERQTKRGRM